MRRSWLGIGAMAFVTIGDSPRYALRLIHVGPSHDALLD
jgi:hypothetical protein